MFNKNYNFALIIQILNFIMFNQWLQKVKIVIGIKMGTFVKKNKLNNSAKWFTFGQKIRP